MKYEYLFIIFFVLSILLLSTLNGSSQTQKDSLEEKLDAQITLAAKARNKGNIDSFFIYIKDVIRQSKKYNLDSKLIYAYLNIVGTFRQLGKMNSCKYYYDNSLALALKIKDTLLIASSYNFKGNVEHIAGNFDKAIEYYNKSLEFKRSMNDMRGVAVGHLNIAQIQVEVDDFESAIQGFEKSLKISEEENLPKFVIHNLVKLGSTYRKSDDFDKAIDYHT